MERSFFDLKGNRAIVTGASRGLGNGIAEGLMREGVEIVMLARDPRIMEIARAHADRGFACHGVAADLSNDVRRERAFDEAVSLLDGRLDILVNAAGMQRRYASETFPLKDWNAVLQLNLTAVFSLCQMAGRIMIAQGRGKIINIASMLSFFGGCTVPAYAASKGGVAQITKALANEWAGRGLNVNALAPGYMDTNMTAALVDDPERNAEILSRIPAGRWGTPEDMAGAACFLAAPASDYLNGAIIPVDGGYLAR